jgi:short-subunit dehydrogenase
VVTGGSSGIGLELARLLAGDGSDVIVCADGPGVHTAAAELDGTSDGSVRAVQADLATPEGVERLVREVEADGRPLEALVLNAGVAHGGPFLETPLEGDLLVIDLNVRAVVSLAKRLVPAMVARSSGRVLITSSAAATSPGPYYATYAASKAFVQSFAEAIRHELKDTGVTVTVLLPGPTDTPFFEASNLEDTPVGSMPKDAPAKVAKKGYKAMLKGKDKVVIRSLKTKQITAMGTALPEKAAAAAHAKTTKPDDA